MLMDGFIEVKNREESDEVPLAKELYNAFDFVKEVYVSDNFVAVTKDDQFQWHEIMNQVRSFIAEFLQAGKTISNLEPHARKSCFENHQQRIYQR
jgi:hypothetical protein